MPTDLYFVPLMDRSSIAYRLPLLDRSEFHGAKNERTASGNRWRSSVSGAGRPTELRWSLAIWVANLRNSGPEPAQAPIKFLCHTSLVSFFSEIDFTLFLIIKLCIVHYAYKMQ
jgi:hypothetical protein